jgi:hypothetical protein
MSEADQYPDPDLSFLEGTTGSDIAAVGRGLDDAAQRLEKQTRELADNAEGATVDRVHESLVAIKQALEKAATHAGHAAQAFDRMQAAWETWKATAPRQAAIAFAERSVADARQRLMDADNAHAGLFRRQLKMAEAKLTELIEQRKEADAALAAALNEAGASIPPVENPRGAPTPGPTTPTPAPTTSTPGPAASAPAPVGELPGTALPGAPLPSPDTSLSGVGETPLTATGSSPNSAAAALAALAAQQQQPQQPVQIPQPQMAPAMAAPQQQQKPAENPFGSAGEPIDLAALLGPAAMGALAGAGAAPAMSSAISSPAITPLNPTAGPTFTPLGPGTSLGGLTAVNPVVQPVVTGTSTAGLTTDSNVSGRADGATPRTATSPGPATGLSGAHADQNATGRPGGMGSGMGMGAPMVPMSPMMGGMGGGGAGKDREMVTATMTPEQARLLGLETIGEAVPGGTIARKED